ncbi:MAG: hypothetical protein ACI4JW_10375 [Oscillospiraceae bacterium]
MKTISVYAFAATVITAKLFALSMYVPTKNENAAVTAAAAIIFSIIKLIGLIPLFFCAKENNGRLTSTLSRAAFAVGAAVFLLIINDSFSTLIETIYPDRFTKAGIMTVLFIIFAYTASMGINGVSRSASLILIFSLATIAVLIANLSSEMLTSRLNMYSEDMSRELFSSVRNLAAYLFDYFLFYGLLPYLDGKPQKTAALYISSEIIISTLFFLTGGAVLGDYFASSGYSFFTLSYSSHGELVARSDVVILVLSTAAAVISGAGLMIILKNSLGGLFRIKNDITLYTAAAAVLTAVILSLNIFGFNFREISPAVSAAAFILLPAGAVYKCAAQLIHDRKGERI